VRIAYAGTPEFAVPALAALAAAGHDVAVVYSQPDRAAGRGRELRASPVKTLARELGAPVEQPASLKGAAEAGTLAAYRPDALVVAAYGLLLPPSILAVPRYGCINIHASLLPRWRGAAPVQRAIEAGDAETGVAIMRMEAGLDTGPVYASRATPIGAGESAGALTGRLADLGAALLLEVLPAIAAGTAVAVPQQSAGVTYARKVDKAEGRIDWSAPATLLARRIRAFQPWPVADTVLAGDILRIWSAEVVDGATTAPPGTVLALGAPGIDVACGGGVLRLTCVQAAGRKPVAVRDYLNAARSALGVGTVFGS
jgi:methionyl-tRNA formyltransferase